METGAGSIWTALFRVERLDPETGEVLAEVDAGGVVEGLEYDDDADVLWALVEVSEKETNAVVAIDPDTNEVVLGPVLLESPGVYGQGMGAADGAAWVAGGRGLERVDLATGAVEKIDISEHFGGPDDTSGFSVAVTHDSVLVIPGNGVVIRVDPDSREHEKVEDLGWNISDVLSDGETVWIVHSSPEGVLALWTLDGITGKAAGGPVRVGKYGFSFAAEHDGVVWVLHGGAEGEGKTATVMAYAGGAGEPVDTIEVPSGGFMVDLAADDSGVWVTTGHEFLYRAEPD